MSERIERAVQNRDKGYNCAQAVICAYCDKFGMDEQTAFRVSEGFGGGIGGMHDGVCGALAAVYMLVGLKTSSGSVAQGISKQTTYAQVQEICAAFKDKNGSIICKDLLGEGAAGVYRPCDGCVEDAAAIVEQYLEANK